MLEAVWAFVKDPANRDTLAWIGGGIVVVAGGLWTVVKFFAKKPEDETTAAGGAKSVRAEQGSVAIGGDNTRSPIRIETRKSGKR